MNKQYRLDASLSAALFFIPFLVYLSTLAPSVYFGDSGELIAMSHTLGLAHPTGFPLYMLLAKLAMLFPAGSAAFRANLFSAGSAAAAVTLLYLAIHAFFRSDKKQGPRYSFIAFGAALAFAFSYTLWSQATIARIYALNALFCTLALYLFFEVQASGSRKPLMLLALVAGLGAGLHLTFVIFASALWAYLSIKYFRLVYRNWAWILLFAFLGLLIYLYLPIRGSSDAVLNWHRMASLKDFIDYITQKQYGRKMFSRTDQGFTAYFTYIRDVLLRELTPAGIVIMLAGLITTLVKRLWLGLVLIVIFASNIALLSVYGNFADLKLAFRYLIPSYIAGIFAVALLAGYLAALVNKRAASPGLAALLITLAFFSYRSARHENDRRLAYLCHDYAQDLVSSLPEKSYVFVTGDNQIYPLAYMKFVGKKYGQMTFFDAADTIFRDIEILKEESRSDRPIPNILVCFNRGYLPLFTATRYQAVMTHETQYGLLYQITEKSGGAPSPQPAFFPWKLFPMRNLLRDRAYLDFEAREVAGTYFYRYAERHFLGGSPALFDYLAQRAVTTGYDSFMVLSNTAVLYTDSRMYQKAEKYFFDALRLNPESSGVYLNLGSLYASNGMFPQAAQMYNRVLELDPRSTAAKSYLDKVDAEMKAADRNRALADEENRKALALLRERKLDEAMAGFRRELSINPLSSRAMFFIGLCHSMKDELKESIRWYENALNIDPANTSALNNLGLTYASLSDTAAAKQYFERSLEADPKQDRVRKLLGELK